MNILFFSDSHGRFRIPDVQIDVLFVLGDIDYYELREIDRTFDCHKFGVLGNHDGFDYFEGTRIKNLHGRTAYLSGLTFSGFEGCPLYKCNQSFGQHTEDEVKIFTEKLDKVDIFIAHANPQFAPTDDMTDPHRGFTAFTDYIDQKKPRFFAHGHLHQNGETKRGDTNIISVYPYHLLTI